jgi:hypothetical protein
MFTKSRFRLSTHFGTETSVLTPVLPVLRSVYRLIVPFRWNLPVQRKLDREPTGSANKPSPIPGHVLFPRRSRCTGTMLRRSPLAACEPTTAIRVTARWPLCSVTRGKSVSDPVISGCYRGGGGVPWLVMLIGAGAPDAGLPQWISAGSFRTVSC